MSSIPISQAALAIARGDIGRGETEGNNRSPWLRSVRRTDGTRARRLDGGSWCASWVSSCYVRAALAQQRDLPFAPTRGARQLAKRIATAGVRLYVPRPGAVICWQRGSGWTGHIGFVADYDAMSGDALILDGNRGPFPSVVSLRWLSQRQWQDDLYRIATV